MTTDIVRLGSGRAGYRAFPNLPHKNVLQRCVEVPALVRALAIPHGRRMLEVGCGRGVALPALARLCRPAYLAGLELDCGAFAEAARTVAATGTAADVFQADVRSMPFPDESFDVVLDFGTCYHVERPEQALAEIERVLAPGGVFVHETLAGQALAHPVRSLGRGLPWEAAPRLAESRTALLWGSRVKR